MRGFLSFLLIGLFAVVNALSSSGNRLLVVLEELGEKEKYSKFFGDLEGESHGTKICYYGVSAKCLYKLC